MADDTAPQAQPTDEAIRAASKPTVSTDARTPSTPVAWVSLDGLKRGPSK